MNLAFRWRLRRVEGLDAPKFDGELLVNVLSRTGVGFEASLHCHYAFQEKNCDGQLTIIERGSGCLDSGLKLPYPSMPLAPKERLRSRARFDSSYMGCSIRERRRKIKASWCSLSEMMTGISYYASLLIRRTEGRQRQALLMIVGTGNVRGSVRSSQYTPIYLFKKLL